MGTVNINGKQFVGNNIAIRDGKVVIDGKLQDVVLNGDVEVQVTESVSGRAECVASVSCENVGGLIQAGGSVTAGDRAGGAIRAVAFASADDGLPKRKKR